MNKFITTLAASLVLTGCAIEEDSCDTLSTVTLTFSESYSASYQGLSLGIDAITLETSSGTYASTFYMATLDEPKVIAEDVSDLSNATLNIDLVSSHTINDHIGGNNTGSKTLLVPQETIDTFSSIRPPLGSCGDANVTIEFTLDDAVKEVEGLYYLYPEFTLEVD